MWHPPWCSVVIPAYNCEMFVARAIESVLCAAGPQREIIVVNDGSTDDTAQVLAAYSSRVTLLSQSNQGVSLARNRGIAAARGQYVICLDADNRLLPEGLQHLASAADSAPGAGLVFGAYQSVDANGRTQPSPLPPPMTTPIENFRQYLSRAFSIGNGSAAVRRDVFSRLQFPAGVTHGEDIVVFAQVLANYDSVSVPEYIVESHDHPGRARNDFAKYLQNGMATIDALFRADVLPTPAMRLRPIFASRWYAELARAAFKLGDRRQARQLYHKAFLTSWTSPLRGHHFGRYLRCYVPQRRAA
jgi:glycosyltransferase involved in cell wall biosynthesis